MKEKLTQLLCLIDVDNNSNSEIAQFMASKLRCDRCKHWDELVGCGPRRVCFSEDQPSSYWTLPDFFCAHFKAAYRA
jgi:hypothetical protein